MTALLMSIFISKNSSILCLLHPIDNHIWFSIFPDLPSHWGLSSKQIQGRQVDFCFPSVFGVLPRLLDQKLSLLWGLERWDPCWSGLWHIFQESLSLVRHISTIEQANSKKRQNKKHFVFLVCFFFTWDDNMLWVSSGSLKSSKQGASWKLLLGRSWQLVGDAHLHLLRSLAPFSPSVENINPLNIHSLSVVDSQPWVRFLFRVAERKLFAFLVRAYVAIDAPLGKNFDSNLIHLVRCCLPVRLETRVLTMDGRLGRCHWCKELPSCSFRDLKRRECFKLTKGLPVFPQSLFPDTAILCGFLPESEILTQHELLEGR